MLTPRRAALTRTGAVLLTCALLAGCASSGEERLSTAYAEVVGAANAGDGDRLRREVAELTALVGELRAEGELSSERAERLLVAAAAVSEHAALLDAPAPAPSPSRSAAGPTPTRPPEEPSSGAGQGAEDAKEEGGGKDGAKGKGRGKGKK